MMSKLFWKNNIEVECVAERNTGSDGPTNTTLLDNNDQMIITLTLVSRLNKTTANSYLEMNNNWRMHREPAKLIYHIIVIIQSYTR